MNYQKSIFKTQSFYLACFLICEDIQLLELNRRPDSKRVFFIFKDAVNRKKLVNSFNFDRNAKVNIKNFIEAQRQLKTALYDNQENRTHNYADQTKL